MGRGALGISISRKRGHGTGMGGLEVGQAASRAVASFGYGIQ